MAEIRLEGVAHSYDGGRTWALRPITMTWESRRAYALLGPSGCGKTTLLNIISGLVTPTEGRIWFGDREVTHVPTHERNIAQVFQFPVIYDGMSVYDNLAFPLRNRRYPKADVDARVRAVSRLLGLEDQLRRRSRTLDPGRQQIVSLGRGLVRSDVAAVLLDEPLTVIDPGLKWAMRSKLKEIHRDTGHTLIYVTHDQTEALTFADEVVVLQEGEVVQTGEPTDLFLEPAHEFVGHFIGSPGMNVLPAEVGADGSVTVGGDTVGRAVPYPGDVATADVGATAGSDGASDDGGGGGEGTSDGPGEAGGGDVDGGGGTATGLVPGPAHVGVRPEFVTPVDGAGPPAGSLTLTARVRTVRRMGAYDLVDAVLAGGAADGSRLVAKVGADSSAEPGTELRFVLEAGRVFLFRDAVRVGRVVSQVDGGVPA
jgi:glycerol transport system ATP-binding protein